MMIEISYLILVLVLMWIFWSCPSSTPIRSYDIQFKQMIKRDIDEMIRRGTRPVITTNFNGFFLQDKKYQN